MFIDNGYYLEDSVDQPFEQKYSFKKKVKIIKDNQPTLLKKLNELLPNKNIPIILIANPVFEANFQFLNDNGFTVLNKIPIVFPFGNHQEKFRKEIATIRLSNEHIS